MRRDSFKLFPLSSLLSAVVLAISIQPVRSSAQTHKGITFQAVIKQPGDTYPTIQGTTVNAKILSPNNCILREEEFNSINISHGYLNLVIGTGHTTGSDPGLSMKQIMDNSQVIHTGPSRPGGLVCLDSNGNVDSGLISYNPTGSSGSRKFRLTIESLDIIADFNMRAMPFAVNAESLDGKSKNDFIQVSDNVTQQKLEDFISSLTAVAGNSVKWDGNSFVAYNPADGTGLDAGSIPDSSIAGLSYSKLTNVPENLGQIAGLSCNDGKVLKKAGGLWACSDAPEQTNAGGDLSGTLSNATVEKIKGQSVSIAASMPGQVLRFNGSQWTPNYISMFDLRSTITGSQTFGAGCTAGQTMTWIAATDNLSCTSISINKSQISDFPTLATSATTDTTNANNITSGTLSIDRLPSSLTNAAWTASDDDIYRLTGNVGIGTLSPEPAQGRVVHLYNNINDGTVNSNALMISQSENRNAYFVTLSPISGGGGIIFRHDATSNISDGGEIVYQHSTRSMQFKTNGSEAVRITESGNFGIGTNFPTAPLHISKAAPTGTISTSSTTVTGVGTNFTASFKVGDIIIIGNYARSVTTIDSDTSMTIDAALSADVTNVTYSHVGTSLLAGNVGVGTSRPLYTLQVAKADSTSYSPFSGSVTAPYSAGSAIIGVYNSEAIDNGAAYLAFNTRVGAGTGRSGYIGQISGTSSDSGSLVFGGRVSAGYQERMRIDLSVGNVGIGNSTPSYKLDVNGDVNSTTRLRISGTEICTSTGCTSSSDKRLKENIRPLKNSLNKILSLRGVDYTYINKRRFGSSQQIGVIAQEVEKVYPEVVRTDSETGLKSVAYDHLVAPIIEAVKTIYTLIVELDKKQRLQENHLASKADSAELTKAIEKIRAADRRIQELELENARRTIELEEIKNYIKKLELSLNPK